MSDPVNLSPSILIVDDHPALRLGLRALFENESDMTVVDDTGGAIDSRPDDLLLGAL